MNMKVYFDGWDMELDAGIPADDDDSSHGLVSACQLARSPLLDAEHDQLELHPCFQSSNALLAL